MSLIFALVAVIVFLSLIVVGLGLRVLRYKAKRGRGEGKPLFSDFPIQPTPLEEIDPVFAAPDGRVSTDAEVYFIGSHGSRSATSDREAWILCCLAKQSRVIFEFGTFGGRTTYLLARNSPPDAEVATVTIHTDDTESMVFDGDDSGHQVRVARRDKRFGDFFYEGTEPGRKVRQIFSDTKMFDETPWLGRCDLIFVDASHAYSYVKSDTEKSLRMLSPGGRIVWHDYGYKRAPGVYNYLNKLAQTLPLHWIEGTGMVVYRDPGKT